MTTPIDDQIRWAEEQVQAQELHVRQARRAGGAIRLAVATWELELRQAVLASLRKLKKPEDES